MYEPVEDGVSDGGIADPFVPGVDGVLAGDEGGAAPLAVVEDLEEEAVLVGLEGRQSPIVDLCGAPHKSTHVETLVMWSPREYSPVSRLRDST